MAENATPEIVAGMSLSRGHRSVTETAAMIRAISRHAGLPAASREVIVVGVPAEIDGAVFNEALTQTLGQPVETRSVVELACLAEMAAREEDTFVYITVKPEHAVAAVVEGRIHLGPAAFVGRRQTTLPEVGAIATVMFGAEQVLIGGNEASPAVPETTADVQRELQGSPPRRLGWFRRACPGTPP